MDFIEGLPKSEGCNVLFVVIDIFPKYANFISLTDHYIAKRWHKFFWTDFQIAWPSTEHCVRQRQSIYSIFWQELFLELGTQLNLFAAYHLQSDVQQKKSRGVWNLFEMYVFWTTTQMEEVIGCYRVVVQYKFPHCIKNVSLSSPLWLCSYTTQLDSRVFYGSCYRWLDDRKSELEPVA